MSALQRGGIDEDAIKLYMCEAIYNFCCISRLVSDKKYIPIQTPIRGKIKSIKLFFCNLFFNLNLLLLQLISKLFGMQK